MIVVAAAFASMQGRTGEAPQFLTETFMIPMRDGVKLSALVYRPETGGRLPTVLFRTPYGKEKAVQKTFRSYLAHGYNVVSEDVRGRNDSDGMFQPLTQEPSDGYDTLNWIAEQSWSNGSVAMNGGSYLGMAQWKAALLGNPHLKAISPVVAGDDDYRDRIYSPGGAMKWGQRLEWVSENMRQPEYEAPEFRDYIWTLPERTAETRVTGGTSRMLELAFAHPSYDRFWKSISTREQLDADLPPAFIIGGWFDNYVEGDLDAFSKLRKLRSTDRILIGPWPHDMSAVLKNANFGPSASVPVRRLQIEWFDQWLKGAHTRLEHDPPVRIFVMGANVWRDENEWPLSRAIAERFYLSSRGHANSIFGDGVLTAAGASGPEDRFIYDPAKPVPTLGGAVCCNPKVFPWGPMDQRSIEKRPDVLVYTTAPLDHDVEVTGPVSLVLYAATSALDTDFTGKLVDVHPDGRAINVADGILRARYRSGVDKPKPIATADALKYTIDLGVTSNVFLKSHRIRIEIASSNFPRFDRNLNTGRSMIDETHWLKAAQTVFHQRGRASYLILQIVPESRLNPHQISQASLKDSRSAGRP